MTISPEMFYAFLAILILGGLVGGGMGWVLGLYFGEKGRRRDVMWWADREPAPADLDKPAHVVPAADPEGAALERAEIHECKEGLRSQLEALGKAYTEKELHEEALRLVTRGNDELAG